jgi:DNA-binding NtrC family response regulator
MEQHDTILVVDDEAGIRLALRSFLGAHGFEVLDAANCEEAAKVLQRVRPDAAILDYMLPDGDALELMPRIRETDPDIPMILLTGHGSIDLAVRAVKQGAENFITKPVELPALLIVVRRAIDNQRARRRELAGRADPGRQAIDPFLGESAAIRSLAEQARKLAASDRPVLVLGETGTGKGVLARWLHDASARSSSGFVDLNCAGLSRELLESELFGHAKGAFTGADSRKLGLLEVVHRGTLFLDEIGDIDLAVQPKLLKVIEDMRFRRLGEVRDLLVDVRFIAATHQDLAELVSQKLFRADLYFRISALPLRVPALRERPEDIPALAERLLQRVAAELGRGAVELSSPALAALQEYAWPGNIRELRNVLERALLLTGSRRLAPQDLIFERSLRPQAAALADSGDLSLAELERRQIAKVLAEEAGNVPRAAERLGIPRSTLYQRIKTYGLKPSSEPA